MLFAFDRKFKRSGIKVIAGVDEAGRGPLAGPVVASAVVLPGGFRLKGLADGKTLTERKREMYYKTIVRDAVAIGIGVVWQSVIDRINIHNATYRAMKSALKKLTVLPDLVLVDGPFTIPGVRIQQKAIIAGDAKSACVACAGIVSKVYRDGIMRKLHTLFPVYGFAVHKGYPTKKHRSAIKKYGICSAHRTSFSLL
ncbi:MAG: ribonuclease HII [Elusimicrobia bacterium]|nr:ribonuclease HII [Elusimicrobiota bacterium]